MAAEIVEVIENQDGKINLVEYERIFTEFMDAYKIADDAGKNTIFPHLLKCLYNGYVCGLAKIKGITIRVAHAADNYEFLKEDHKKQMRDQLLRTVEDAYSHYCGGVIPSFDIGRANLNGDMRANYDKVIEEARVKAILDMCEKVYPIFGKNKQEEIFEIVFGLAKGKNARAYTLAKDLSGPHLWRVLLIEYANAPSYVYKQTKRDGVIRYILDIIKESNGKRKDMQAELRLIEKIDKDAVKRVMGKK